MDSIKLLWRQANKDYVSAYNKQYVKHNRDKINELMKKQRHCEFCDRSYSIANFCNHCNTKKHMTNVAKRASIQ
jgi:hypothetical protein